MFTRKLLQVVACKRVEALKREVVRVRLLEALAPKPSMGLEGRGELGLRVACVLPLPLGRKVDVDGRAVGVRRKVRCVATARRPHASRLVADDFPHAVEQAVGFELASYGRKRASRGLMHSHPMATELDVD